MWSLHFSIFLLINVALSFEYWSKISSLSSPSSIWSLSKNASINILLHNFWTFSFSYTLNVLNIRDSGDWIWLCILNFVKLICIGFLFFDKFGPLDGPCLRWLPFLLCLFLLALVFASIAVIMHDDDNNNTTKMISIKWMNLKRIILVWDLFIMFIFNYIF